MKIRAPVPAIESAALTATRDLLNHVPGLQGVSIRREQPNPDGPPMDARVDFRHGDAPHALIIEIKSNGAPRFVRSAVYQLKGYIADARQSVHDDSSRRWIPMIVSPYLSPESRSICVNHDVAYVDLVGNARLAFDSVYIDRAVPHRPKSEARALRSIFTPKAAAILRVLLRDSGRPWRVADLAKTANASLGHVSNVRRALLEREWCQQTDKGIILAQPSALLTTWRQNYRRPAGNRVTGYTPLHGEQLRRRLSGTLNPEPQRPRAVYAAHSAAQWFAPFARSATDSFYADEPGARKVGDALALTPTTLGANVVLHITSDESLFEDAVQPAPDTFCVNPIITYLDLWNGNDRDRESADHLAAKCFPWL